MEIRDPIHGPISLSEVEIAVLAEPLFQRLRNVKQLGFAELLFPGAAHNRWLHSIGVMHLAGLAFDAVFGDADWLGADDRQRLRQTLRLAGMLHDVGHAPLSHSSESLFPSRAALALPDVDVGDPTRQARHEHYTVKLLLDSPLGATVDRAGAPLGLAARHVAALLHDGVRLHDAPFVCGSRDVRPLLSTLCSGEVDVDRMDYLRRDSYFTGVSYGTFDADWLISHLTRHEADDGRVALALEDRALYTFDDFLLSRLHMFLMVYFHPKVVCFDQMLRRFYDERPELTLPLDPDDFARFDDASIWRALRDHAGRSRWAAGITQLRPLPLVGERGWHGRDDDLDGLEAALQAEGLDFLRVTSHGVLSKYRDRGAGDRAIFVRLRPRVGPARVVALGKATTLFRRRSETTVMERTYVTDEGFARAAAVLTALRAGRTDPHPESPQELAR